MNSDLSRGTSRNNSWHRLSTEENMQKRPDLCPTHPSRSLWSWLCFKTDSTYSFFPSLSSFIHNDSAGSGLPD